MAKNINYNIKVGVIGDAQLQKFQRTVDKINKSAKQNVTQMKRMGDGMNKMGRAARTAAGYLVTMFGAQQISSALKYADAIGKTADKLGISTDALQEYRFAADQTGVAQTAFDVGFQRFTRRTAEAAKGTGVLVKEFKALGITLTNTDGTLKGNEVLFKQYADAIAGTTSSSEQLRLAFAAFDTEGAGLVNLLRTGSEGLDGFTAAARQAGTVMSSDVIRNSERLTDIMSKLSTVFKVQLYPILIGIVDGLTNFGASIRQFTDDVKNMETPALVLAAAIGVLASAFTVSLVPAIVGGLAKITTAVIAFTLSNPFTAIAYAATVAIVAIIANWQRVSDFFTYQMPIALTKLKSDWYYAMSDLLSFSAVGVRAIVKLFDDMANALVGPLNALRELVGYNKIVIDITTTTMQSLGTTIGSLDKAGSDLYWTVKDMEKAFELSKNKAVEVDAVAKALIPTFQELTTVTDSVADKAKELADNLAKVAEEIDNKLGKALEDGIINSAKGAKDAFKDMAKSILEDMARMVLQAKIIKPLMASLGLGGSAAGFLSPSASGNYFPNGVQQKPMTAFASGGIIGSRSVVGSNLIGENGPEAVMPLRRHNGKMGVAASPVNVNVINNAGAEVQVSESTGNDGSKSIDIMIDTKVRDAFSSGRMDKTMRANYGVKRVGA